MNQLLIPAFNLGAVTGDGSGAVTGDGSGAVTGDGSGAALQLDTMREESCCQVAVCAHCQQTQVQGSWLAQLETDCLTVVWQGSVAVPSQDIVGMPWKKR